MLRFAMGAVLLRQQLDASLTVGIAGVAEKRCLPASSLHPSMVQRR
jgi:hypothetical protein